MKPIVLFIILFISLNLSVQGMEHRMDSKPLALQEEVYNSHNGETNWLNVPKKEPIQNTPHPICTMIGRVSDSGKFSLDGKTSVAESQKGAYVIRAFNKKIDDSHNQKIQE